ncbi:response regulator transcription factor [Synechococcus sp. CC9311]|uniref:response regulator transcription factor n=1 Tax=Synechococcus sp. (strain CC9311) TaxID=64471 RepID=UPI00030DAA2C|nr:response regulator transcription factor [Synechococcus sp. CC9311]
MSKHDHEGQQPKSQVLLVDDDPELLSFLYEEFTSDKVTCTCSKTGSKALTLLRQQRFDLVVLDWNLPDFDGLEICQRLRSSGNTTPVLMLTAHDDLDARVQALDYGADDYISKPFELRELHARVRARLRRGTFAAAEKQKEQLELGDLRINLLKRAVHRGEHKLSLTQREFDLLCYLIGHHGEVLHRKNILEGVWGAPFVGDPNTLDVYMGYLRRKVEKPDHPQLLHTIRGIGFMARLEKTSA